MTTKGTASQFPFQNRAENFGSTADAGFTARVVDLFGFHFIRERNYDF
jgi:hypothetical protein